MKSVYKYSLKREKSCEVRESADLLNPLSSAEAVFEICKALGLDQEEQEQILVFFLDVKNKIKGYTVSTVGLIDQTSAHPREIFRNAILQGASSIIMVHNHPSGDHEPSLQDHKLTDTVKRASEIISIRLLDHLIIGENDFYSFAANGKI